MVTSNPDRLAAQVEQRDKERAERRAAKAKAAGTEPAAPLTQAEIADIPVSELAALYDAGKLAHLTGGQAPSTESNDDQTDNNPDDGHEDGADPTAPVTAQELATMSTAEIVEAYDAGRLSNILEGDQDNAEEDQDEE